MLLVNDAKTRVSVSKADIATGKELPGATIQVLDSEENVVAQWVSEADDASTEGVDESVHVIEGLKTGETYTLRETVAPEGYAVATDTTFQIAADGTVTTTGTKTEGGVLLVNDAKLSNETGTLVIKKSVGGDVTAEELEAAAITFEVKNADGKWLDKDGNVSETQILLTLGGADGFVTADGGKTWTKTFEKVAPGAYTVSEKNALVEGYDLVTTGDNASITEAEAAVAKGSSATAELKDEYVKQEIPKTGDLKVTKTFGGDVTAEELAKGAIKFTVAKMDGDKVVGYLNAKGELVASETQLTLGDADGFVKADGVWTKTFTGVELGIYKVTETNYDLNGFTIGQTTKVEDRATVTAETVGDKAAAAALVDEYVAMVPGTGSIELTKTIKGDITAEEAAGALRFTVETPEGKFLKADGTVSDTKVELTLADFTKTGENSWRLVIDGVATGEGYKVTETTTGPDGKDVTVTRSVNGAAAEESDTATVGVAEGATAKVAFEDDYPAPTGTLVIKKSVGGDVTAEELEAAAITFEVKNADGKWLDKDGNVSETQILLTLGGADGFVTADGGKTWTKTFEKVAPGAYTVSEKNALVEGYDLVTTGDNASVTSAEAAVAKDGTATADLKDEYVKKETPGPAPDASPALEKYINKDVHQDLPAFDTPFTYDILAYVTKDANTVIIKDPLVKGIRFLDGKDTEVAVQDIGEANDHTAHGTVEKAEGKDVKSTVTVDDEGKLLTVDIPDAGGQGLRGHWVRVTYKVTLDNHVVSDEKDYEDNDVNVYNNGTVISNKYPNGTANRKSHDGVVTNAEYKVLAENDKTYELKANDITVTPPVKTVSVAKKWAGADGGELAWPEGAKVVVEMLGNGKSLDVVTAEIYGADKAIEKRTLELTADKTSVTFENLPTYEDIEYSVAEVSVTGVPEGFTSAVSGDAEGGFVVTNTKAPEPAPEVGDLKVTKTFGGDVSAEELAKGAIAFEITTTVDGKTMYLDASCKLTETRTALTLGKDGFVKGADGVWTKTFAGVPVGAYKVTETNYELGGFTMDSETVTSANAAVTTKTVGQDAAVAALKNFYEKKIETGKLVIEKTVKGGVTDTEVKGALKFEVTTTDGGKTKWLDKDGNLSATKVTLEIKDGFVASKDKDGNLVYTKTFDAVPLGKYTITETNSELGGNWKLKSSASVTKTEVEITKGGQTATAKLTDTYEKTTTTSGKSSPKTGDDATGLALGFALLSMLSAGAVGISRRRMRLDD